MLLSDLASPLWIAVLLLLAVIAGALLFAWLSRAWDRRARIRRARLAQRGENRGRELLEAAGYRVLEEQSRRIWRYEANGVLMEAELRADYLVQRKAIRYVADAKTGGASTLKSIATRRQLLEYQLAFQVPAVILLDMERDRLHVVRFFAQADETESD